MLYVLYCLEKIDEQTFNATNKECLEITKEVYHFIKYLEKNNLEKK